MAELPPLRALILTGGHSQRMGTDKATLHYAQQPQLQRAATLLQSLGLEVSISARADQQDALRQQWPVITDVQAIGPIAGIAAAQTSDPRAAWLVIACDLPLLDQQTLQTLIAARSTNQHAVAFTASDGLPEPLCAIYEPSSAAAIRQAMQQQPPSPRRVLQALHYLPVTPPNPLTLQNINTPSEYQALCQQLADAHTMSRTVTLQYFAILREQAGTRSERLTTSAATMAELYAALQQRYGFTLPATQLKVARGQAFCDWQAQIMEGDVITFIPPVAGG